MSAQLQATTITREEYYLFAALVVAILASLGSLYFSEWRHFLPCVLCWYQRTMMYPLILILGVGIYRRDKHAALYGLPLSVAGMVIAIYHNLLYDGIVPESAAPCVAGISCTTQYILWFGFITIPLLSLTAFTIITLLLAAYHRRTKSL